MKTILVAGGAGFVGSYLCEALLEKGHRVYAIDNLVTGRRKNINHLLTHPQFTWLEHDIIFPLYMNVPCNEIYNLASPASPVDFEKIPDYILKTAAVGHLNLLNWAKSNNAKILYASTSEVYGDPQVHPQSEDYLGHVDCTGLRGCYDEAKRFGEALTLSYQRRYGTQVRIVRIFNTYGPRMRPEDGRVIPNFFNQALKNVPMTIYGDGKQTRSLCFVSDLVEGLIKLMDSSIQTPVNLGNPDEYTILDIAKKVSEICNVEFKSAFLPLPSGDPKQRRPNISKATELLGWKPSTSLKEGLEKTLAYFKSELV